MITSVMEEGAMVFSRRIFGGGTPYAVKAARTVRSGGKAGDNFKRLPIAIIQLALVGGMLVGLRTLLNAAGLIS